MNNRERLKVRDVSSCSNPAYIRLPLGCESPNHLTFETAENTRDILCYGYLRKCPACGRMICYQDGAADIVDDTLPGICDTCADQGRWEET